MVFQVGRGTLQLIGGATLVGQREIAVAATQAARDRRAALRLISRRRGRTGRGWRTLLCAGCGLVEGGVLCCVLGVDWAGGVDWLGVVSCASATEPASNKVAVTVRTVRIEFPPCLPGRKVWKWLIQLDIVCQRELSDAIRTRNARDSLILFS